jgi:hypothetical protein
MTRKQDIKEIDRIAKEVDLSREQRRLLQRAITGQNLSLEEVREVAKEIKELYPNK